jgi:rare lipoprotein A (peptidoglycan hydrolase)
MGLCLLLAPLLLLRNPTAPERGEVLAAAGASDTGLDPVAPRHAYAARASRSSHTGRVAAQAILASVDVTAPPTTAAPATTAPPRRLTAVAKAAPTSTTTTRPPAPKPRPTTTTSSTSTTATPPPAHSATGEASWYVGPDGECAHNTAPLGSTIRVTNLDNGKSTTCRVAGRGPYGAGRVVDLTKSTFARIASIDAGVFHARVDW